MNKYLCAIAVALSLVGCGNNNASTRYDPDAGYDIEAPEPSDLEIELSQKENELAEALEQLEEKDNELEEVTTALEETQLELEEAQDKLDREYSTPSTVYIPPPVYVPEPIMPEPIISTPVYIPQPIEIDPFGHLSNVDNGAYQNYTYTSPYGSSGY